MFISIKSGLSDYKNYIHSRVNRIDQAKVVVEPGIVDARVHVYAIDMLNACFNIIKLPIISMNSHNPISKWKLAGEGMMNEKFFCKNVDKWKNYSIAFNAVPQYQEKLDGIIQLTQKFNSMKMGLMRVVVNMLALAIILGMTGSLLCAFAGALTGIFIQVLYSAIKCVPKRLQIESKILFEINSLENDPHYQKYIETFKTRLNFPELRKGLEFSGDLVTATK